MADDGWACFVLIFLNLAVAPAHETKSSLLIHPCKGCTALGGRPALQVKGNPCALIGRESGRLDPELHHRLARANTHTYLQTLPRGFGSPADSGQRDLLRLHSTSFHTFCSRIASELYAEWVKLPIGYDLQAVRRQYDLLGFTGTMRPIDAMHVAWGRAPYSHSRSYTGKEGEATLAYEVTVDHSGRILGATRGFPGAQDGKTIIRHDTTVQRVREGEPYKSVEFTVKKADGTGRTIRGLHLICDGGYHEVNPACDGKFVLSNYCRRRACLGGHTS